MSPLDQPADSPEPTGGSMPFLEHVEELRKRLLRAALGVIIGTLLALYFSDDILRWFIAPLGNIKLHVTEVTGSFTAYLKVAIITGLGVALPYVLFQLWAFVSPGLYRREKNFVATLVAVSTLLFLAGAAFCYYIVLPFSLKFMIGFAGDLLSPIITINSYLSFSGMLMLAFGVSFELPVIAYFLGRIGMITAGTLARGRRIAIVVILILAAILTPTPDVFTQLLLAVPLYLLYEISIIILVFTAKKRHSEVTPDET